MSWFTSFYYAQVKFANLVVTRSSMPAQQKAMHQLTFPKYRSRTSTYRWMISSVTSSLSPDPTPVTKNSDAYRRYTTLVSVYKCVSSFSVSISSSHTFVLQKITHSRPASQHQLSYVLHNLCLGFGRHRREPFRQTNFA
jgi:hypothetical protein